MEKIKIDFIQDAVYDGKITHKAGETAELSEDMATRWIRRGIAVNHVPKTVKTQEKNKSKTEEKKDESTNSDDLGKPVAPSNNVDIDL